MWLSSSLFSHLPLESTSHSPDRPCVLSPRAPQVVTLDEVRVREALDTLRAAYRKGLSARHQVLLEADPLRSPASVAAHAAAGARLPRDYRCRVVTAAAAAKAAAAAAEAAAEALQGGAGGVAGGSRLRRLFPPASTEPDSYTVIKFNMLDDAMLHSGRWAGRPPAGAANCWGIMLGAACWRALTCVLPFCVKQNALFPPSLTPPSPLLQLQPSPHADSC